MIDKLGWQTLQQRSTSRLVMFTRWFTSWSLWICSLATPIQPEPQLGITPFITTKLVLPKTTTNFPFSPEPLYFGIIYQTVVKFWSVLKGKKILVFLEGEDAGIIRGGASPQHRRRHHSDCGTKANILNAQLK